MYSTHPGALTAAINYYRCVIQYKRIPYPHGMVVTPPSLLIWGTKDFALSLDGAKASLK